VQRCGIRPLVVKKGAHVGRAEWTAYLRKQEIDIHPERKMLSIYGGKLIDRINVGEEVAEIIESFGIELLSSLKPWYGESAGLDAFQILEKTAKDPSMADTVVEAEFARYFGYR